MRQYQRVNKGITLEFLEFHQVETHSGKSKLTLTVPVPLRVTGYVLREDACMKYHDVDVSTRLRRETLYSL